MGRTVSVVVRLAVVVGLMLLAVPFSGGGSDSDTTETAVIKDYDAAFTVGRDGTLHAVETLKVDFPVSRHGIFRFFDTRDPNDSHVRYEPKDISVTRDGESDGLDLSRQGHGRYVVAKIGEEGYTMTGEHTYVIRYDVPGAISGPLGGSGAGARSTFYWNLIPAGWQMPIEQSSLRVALPARTTATPRCAVGVGSTAGCNLTADGDTIRVTTDKLEPHTPVTLQAPLDLAPPGQHTLPWTGTLDPVLGRSVPAVVVFGLLALAAIAAGLVVARAVREPEPSFPLMYAPPEGIGPAQGAYLLNEATNDDAYAATMLQLGEKGLAELRQDGDAWTLTGKKGDWTGVDAITGQTAAELGLEPGRSFTAQPGDVEGGKQMQEARNGFDGAVKAWARGAGLMEFRWLPRLGSLVVIGCALLCGYLFFWNPQDMALAGLPFGFFAVLGLPLLDPASASFRTKSGRDAWSRIGGFKRVLGTTSSEARFDFAGRHDLYLQYVPWAVAFGVADVWAQKFRVETRQEPPLPPYFVGYTPISPSAGMNDFSTSFSSSVSSAISAYSATQSSSSGGGGFSGGGGGGGGGGGSW